MSRPSSYNWEGREKSAGQICSEDLGTADLTFKTNPCESRSRGVKTKDAPLSEPKVKPGVRNCLLWQGMDTIPKKVNKLKRKTEMPLYGPLAFLIKAWHASPSWFAHPEQCLLGPIQQPSPTAKARGCFGKAHLPFTSHDGTASGFLASIHSIPHFSKQRTFCLPWPPGSVSSHALLG